MGNLTVPKIEEPDEECEYIYTSIYREVFTNIYTGQVCNGLTIYSFFSGNITLSHCLIFSDNEPLFLEQLYLDLESDWFRRSYEEGLDKLYNIPGVREDYWQCWTSTIKTNAIIDYIMYSYSEDILDSLYKRVFIRQSDIERRNNE